METLEGLDQRVAAAVRQFWRVRDAQARKQDSSGRKDQGARGSVTGGAQMDGFIDLLTETARLAGAKPESIICGPHSELPGFFRPTIAWDVVIYQNQQVLCAFKIATYPGSIGAVEYDRLVENTLTSAYELWHAYSISTLNYDIKPWLGYLLVAGSDGPECRESETVATPAAQAAGQCAGSKHRGELLCRGLLRDQLYDGTAFLLTEPDGSYTQPASDLQIDYLCRALACRVSAYECCSVLAPMS